MDAFDLNSYLCRRKVMALTGQVHVYSDTQAVVAYSKQKAFKLKEEIRVFTDETQTQLLLMIKARQIIDFGATYDVTDSSGAPLGALRRKGLKSILKDQWFLLGPGDQEIGTIDEDNTILALARRFVPLAALLIAQEYSVNLGGQTPAAFKRNQNPFVSKLKATIQPAVGKNERKLLLAAAVLLLLVEGKQG